MRSIVITKGIGGVMLASVLCVRIGLVTITGIGNVLLVLGIGECRGFG